MELAERKQTYRKRVESQETYRDYVIDIVGVWGPLLAPAVPAALTMVSIAMHYPELLHIHWLAAIAIGLIVAVVIEVLGVVSVETFLDMQSYNQTIGEDEESAPAGWAGAIMGLYIAIVISLVVLLKMVPELALVSLVPLTLLAGVTSWIVVMRKQHRERTYKRELAELEESRKHDLMAIIEDLKSRLDAQVLAGQKLGTDNRQLSEDRDRLLSEIAELRGQIEGLKLGNANQIPNFGPQQLPAANEKRSENVQDRRAAIVGMLERGDPMKRSDIQEKLSELGFDISADTLRNDLNDIGAIRNGYSYTLPVLELPTLPAHQPTAPALNGNGRH